MKILQIHNSYKIGGGEDIVVRDERKVLEEKGTQVIPYYKHNKIIDSFSFLQKALLPFRSIWSQKSYNEIIEIIDLEQPHICHIHNVFPLISPSIYFACKKKGVPVVQTIHNYRFMCPNGLFFKENKICENCVRSTVFSSLKSKCYRNSRIQTFVMALSIFIHQRIRTFKDKIDGYIFLTDFAADKFKSQGYDTSKFFIKPNFKSSDANEHINREIKTSQAPYFIFIGRIEESKGSKYLEHLAHTLSKIRIYVIGEGDTNSLKKYSNVKILGKLPNEQVISYLSSAQGLLFPSRWYEGMPMVIIEAFSKSIPVICSNLESLSSIVINNYNGLTFEYDNVESFVAKVALLEKDKSLKANLGKNARHSYVEKYSINHAYENLISLYNKLLH